jgi:hypothetical protein
MALPVPAWRKPVQRCLGEVVNGFRRAVLRDVGGRGADDELQRHDAPRNDAALGRRAGAKADVDAVLHPVADAVVHVDVGVDLRMAAAILFQHGPQHVQHDGARRDDAQRAGDFFAAAPRAVQGALQGGQARLRGFQELHALFGQAQAARGAVEEAHTQVAFELHQRLAGGLRRDGLGGGGLAQAAELGRLDKGGDGAQFIQCHSGFSSEAMPIITIYLIMNSSTAGYSIRN